MNDPKCKTLLPWLRSNLGKRCLAPLTTTDALALSAAVQIIELYCYCEKPSVLMVFHNCVMQMQETTRELAYHAIAHCREWQDREAFWMQAGLPPISRPRVCSFEPGGRYIDLAKVKG